MRLLTVVCRGTGLATYERRDLFRGANNDVIVTDVKCRGEKIMTM